MQTSPKILSARDETLTLNREIPVPLYYQISQLLRQQISTGELKPGDQIPTESELQARFKVSRATVRQAIAQLVYEGLLERRRSKGTIVSKAKLTETLYEFGSFTNEVFKSGRVPTSRLLHFDFIAAPDHIAERLQAQSGETLVWLERLRLVDGEPVGLENWYARAKNLPGIQRSDFKETGREQSTYYVVQEKFGIPLVKAIDLMSAVPLDEREAKLLGLDTGMPALLRARTTFTTNDVPVIYAAGLYIMTLTLTLEPKGSSTVATYRNQNVASL